MTGDVSPRDGLALPPDISFSLPGERDSSRRSQRPREGGRGRGGSMSTACRYEASGSTSGLSRSVHPSEVRVRSDATWSTSRCLFTVCFSCRAAARASSLPDHGGASDRRGDVSSVSAIRSRRLPAPPTNQSGSKSRSRVICCLMGRILSSPSSRSRHSLNALRCV